jgi:hypothetical protein
MNIIARYRVCSFKEDWKRYEYACTAALAEIVQS